jgi:hypothetical protein
VQLQISVKLNTKKNQCLGRLNIILFYYSINEH